MLNSIQQFSWQKVLSTLLSFLLAIFLLLLIATPTALASLNDDRFDGNIFALYAGNGSLVPARVTLKESLNGSKPALLVFFLDDSKDCKQFSTVVSQLQAFYGRAASFIPVNVDAIISPVTDDSTQSAYYYEGFVPQTVLIDQEGKVVLNAKGQVAFEKVDDAFREVFDLLPRSESVELKRRIVNEINVELSN
ncbi:MAG: thioredoxin family protein [Okeania sp. SIO2C2]|uniref:thylakoid membrane photosystem I accumulation factor n=1 Tax=Okeania sp. SIO2C2 TaxID=2607787 RepID=UPI0013BB9876|nr:thylakoid membrane photosystem I accumulation factor [Okeania sp. SIO2C2]NEP87953.1 thioredoxin family protein [Okeania sp. SIO2C2]